MQNKQLMVMLCLICLFSDGVFAQPPDGVGQTIQINTRLHSFVGKPSWLLVIRDVDHNQNIPYLYDFERGENFWLAFTFSRNYMVLASTLSFSPYSTDPARTRKIYNFCNLESQGRIMRGLSMTVTLTGNLTPNERTFSCYVTIYPGTTFTIVTPDSL